VYTGTKWGLVPHIIGSVIQLKLRSSMKRGAGHENRGLAKKN